MQTISLLVTPLCLLIHLLTASRHVSSPVVLYHSQRLADRPVFFRSLVFTAIAAVGHLLMVQC